MWGPLGPGLGSLFNDADAVDWALKIRSWLGRKSNLTHQIGLEKQRELGQQNEPSTRKIWSSDQKFVRPRVASKSGS